MNIVLLIIHEYMFQELWIIPKHHWQRVLLP